MSLNDAELEKEYWTCTSAVYENGKIVCIVPKLEEYEQDSLQFNVDIALNGQQFTSKPLPFRYYDIQVEQIVPVMGPSEGGTQISIMGQGLYDSGVKKVKFEIDGGERVVTGQWDRKNKCITCVVPPLTWLFGGEEKDEEELAKIKKQPIRVYLTFNG